MIVPAARHALPLAALLALAACGSPEPADDGAETVGAGAVDVGSGSTIETREVDPNEIPVDVPDAEMTEVPMDEITPPADATTTQTPPPPAE
ncbi:hypothetical protein [Aurantiacibacter spongiae]|uniref:Argininosuccinate lyase n=1 Tax=Aurantiacibacter spongiae TaxID=2488860 RepID=A0A3N5CVV8_9SPHN|nr:hypothetical protein [Aurantiacibacter spongiae]RPF71630.1 hypothetical protein EG799_08350 [Aurantiacibacter spongiae]